MTKKTKKIGNNKRPRPVSSWRGKKEVLDKYKQICRRNKISHCKMTEILVNKFIRGEIIILQKDFEI